MPSLATYKTLENQGILLDSMGAGLFNKYDNLEDETDLSALFEILSSVKDKNGNFAVFTAVTAVANPDFDKIQKENFNEYYYEPFNITYNKHQSHNSTFGLWKEGVNSGVFIPQSHGREHLNTILWLQELQAGDKDTLLAFQHGIWGFVRKDNKPSYQVAFSFGSEKELEKQALILEEGFQIFEDLFGNKPSFFVPPNGVLDTRLEYVTHRNNIKALFGTFIQEYPAINYKTKKGLRYLGKLNQHGQKYILRNCLFEPNEPNIDWVNIAMRDIETAFQYHKPAILGPHRKNFIGSLDEKNRTKGLDTLRSLLRQIVKKWPDVEFIHSGQLSEIMTDN